MPEFEGSGLEVSADYVETASTIEASDDDRTLATFSRLVEESPLEVVTEYDGTLGNNRGNDEVLQKFIADNEQYMSQAQLDRFQRSFRTANLFAQSAHDEHDKILAAKLKEHIRGVIIPMIKKVIRQKRTQLDAHSGVDAVPTNIQPYESGNIGRIATTKHQTVTKRKKDLNAIVLQELKQSNEYGLPRCA